MQDSLELTLDIRLTIYSIGSESTFMFIYFAPKMNHFVLNRI